MMLKRRLKLVAILGSLVAIGLGCSSSVRTRSDGFYATEPDGSGELRLNDPRGYFCGFMRWGPSDDFVQVTMYLDECHYDDIREGVFVSVGRYQGELSNYMIFHPSRWTALRDAAGEELTRIVMGSNAVTEAALWLSRAAQQARTGSPSPTSPGATPSYETSGECRMNSDCEVGQFCGNGVCTTECRENRDCLSGQTCNTQNGRCE